MARLLDISIAARDNADLDEDGERNCFKVMCAMVSARWNVKRIGDYVEKWSAQAEKDKLSEELMEKMAL